MHNAITAIEWMLLRSLGNPGAPSDSALQHQPFFVRVEHRFPERVIGLLVEHKSKSDVLARSVLSQRPTVLELIPANELVHATPEVLVLAAPLRDVSLPI